MFINTLAAFGGVFLFRSAESGYHVDMDKRNMRRWARRQMNPYTPVTPLPRWAVLAIGLGILLIIALKLLGIL